MRMVLFYNRKSNRLKGYDYSSVGYYFVTICTKNRESFFGDVRNGEMILNLYGRIIHEQWMWLKMQYPYILLDEFVIMPNHVHGIVILNNFVGNGRDRSLQKIKTLSSLIGAFKTTSSKRIHGVGATHFQWQKSFYDHIIRNEIVLEKIREYIRINPTKWNFDRNNPKNCWYG